MTKRKALLCGRDFFNASANNLVDTASKRAKAVLNSFGRENSTGLTVDSPAFR
jgi:hypothetical protein